MFNKYYLIYFLVLLFINVRISLQFGPVSLRVHRADLIESQSCEQSGWSCKDCGTLQRCGPDNIFKFQISCADQFPDRPYCDPSIGRCVSDRHVCSEMKDPEFKCPDVGIYPDLTDCRRYISCRSKGDVGLIYSCLFQSVYNPIAKRCITHSYCYDPIIDCNGDYKTMAYNLDPSLYIVCRGDQKPLIKDCGSKMLEYDPSLLACDFKCKEEGRFAHPTNNTLFYICVYNNNEIVRMMGLCREGTIYDEIYDTCVYNFDITSTTHSMEVTTELETFTEEETLETTTNNFYETTIDNNDQTLETTASNVEQNAETTLNEEQNLETTTAANVEQNSETTLNEELILETTTDYKNKDETTINNQDFETTSEDALSSVTIDEESSTHDAIEEDSTTENLITKETTTISNRSDTTFTTDNIEVDLTTNSNIVNVTNSSEESLETTEKNSPEETDETEENNMNEETEDTKEDNTKEDVEQTDSEETEETEEIQSKSTEEKDKSNNNSNEWKNEKHKCRGRICWPKWKIPGFLKKHNSNK